MKKEGVKLQTSQKLAAMQREEAFELLDTRWSLRQVAKQFGVTAESIRRLANRRKSGEQKPARHVVL